jgi:hypothetical protein
MRHYDLGGDHFATTNGYESYAEIAKLIQAAGHEASAQAYAEANTYGTPDEMIEKVQARREVVGDYHLNAIFSYGGMPYDSCESSMRLFADKVIPALREIGVAVPAAG